MTDLKVLDITGSCRIGPRGIQGLNLIKLDIDDNKKFKRYTIY